MTDTATPTKLGPLNCAGEMWTHEVSGRTFYMDERSFVLTSEGDVYEDTDAALLLSPTGVADKVRALAAEDTAIHLNRVAESDRLSGGNRALATVLYSSMSFNDGAPRLSSFNEHPGMQTAKVHTIPRRSCARHHVCPCVCPCWWHTTTTKAGVRQRQDACNDGWCRDQCRAEG